MKKIGLLISQSEPYSNYYVKLISSLKNRGMAADVVIVENNTISTAGNNSFSLLAPCSNAVDVPLFIRFYASIGVRVLNKGIATVGTDRISINSTLSAAGAPVPQFWAALNASIVHSIIPDQAYPIILKSVVLPKQDNPIFYSSEDLRYYILSHLGLLKSINTFFYCEKYLAGADLYLKVYVCGKRHSVYRKYADHRKTPTQVASTSVIESLILIVKSKLELDYFSMDLVDTPNGLLAVDVNTLPIYKYHPEAYDWLAGDIADCVE